MLWCECFGRNALNNIWAGAWVWAWAYGVNQALVKVHKIYSIISIQKLYGLLKNLFCCRMSIRVLNDAHIRISQTLNYNIFIIFSASSAVEFFGGLGSLIFAEKLGRRSTNITFFLVIAVIEASMALVPQGKGMKTITNMWISQDQIIHRICLPVNIFMANVCQLMFWMT